jgi:hypothetical protein
VTTTTPPPTQNSTGSPNGTPPGGAGAPGSEPAGWGAVGALPVALTAAADITTVLSNWEHRQAYLAILVVGLAATVVILSGLRLKRLSGRGALGALLTLVAATGIAVLALAGSHEKQDTGTDKTDVTDSPPTGQAAPTPPAPTAEPTAPPDATAPGATDALPGVTDGLPTTSAAPATTPAPVAPPVAARTPADSAPATDDPECVPAVGGLVIPDTGNEGGPNYVPVGCSEIGIQLTAVTQVTYAQACLELPDGSPTGQCGTWVRLVDGGAWNVLYPGVSPGTRWLLRMRADAPESVEFLYTHTG